MSDYDPIGPWRVGGQAHLGDKPEDEFVELKTGRDIWRADGSPVIHLADWYASEDLELIASAPTLRADLDAALTREAALRDALERVMRACSCRFGACIHVAGQIARAALSANPVTK